MPRSAEQVQVEVVTVSANEHVDPLGCQLRVRIALARCLGDAERRGLIGAHVGDLVNVSA